MTQPFAHRVLLPPSARVVLTVLFALVLTGRVAIFPHSTLPCYSALMIYLHPPSSHPALLALLRPLLPSSMLLYNSILLPSNSDLPIWCSFPPAPPPQVATPPEAPSPAPPSAQQGRGWVIIADHGNQLRLFHSLEAAGEGSVGEGEQEEQAEAENLVLSCLKAWFAQLPAERSSKSRALI